MLDNINSYRGDGTLTHATYSSTSMWRSTVAVLTTDGCLCKSAITSAVIHIGRIITALLLISFPATVMAAEYQQIHAWGSFGTGAGEFNEPTGVAVSESEVFVSDARNGRIQVFNHQGAFLREFGNSGEKQARLGRPMNLELHDGRLYVADYWHERIQVYSQKGEYLRTIQTSDEDMLLNGPGGVAFSKQGNLFVADFYNHRIAELTPEGALISQIGTPGESGFWGGEFSYPTDVATGEDGTLYVADGYNDRIQQFSAQGVLIRKWGGPFAMNIHGSLDGWFSVVTSIAVGPEGDVFVADFYNNRVQKFTPDGKFITSFTLPAEEPSHSAIALDVDASGTLFVANFAANQVTVWREKSD